MKAKLAIMMMAAVALMPLCAIASPGGDDFGAVVRTIEQFYHVKHQNLPLLARAGIAAMKTGAKIRGDEYKRIAEAGSVRVVFFEDQNFDSRGNIAAFKASLQTALASNWSALVQTLAPRDEEQTHVYVRDAGKNFQVLVITIARHEATVVQATVSPQALADLVKNPDEIGKSLTDEATTSDP